MKTIEADRQGNNVAREGVEFVLGAVSLGAILAGMTWGGHELGSLIFGDDKADTPQVGQVTPGSLGDNRTPSDVALTKFTQRSGIQFNL